MWSQKELTTRPITIVIADTEKMLGEFKEGRVTSVWGSTCQTEEAVRGRDESREEERQSGQEETLGTTRIHGVRRTRVQWGPEVKSGGNGAVEAKTRIPVIRGAKGQECGVGGCTKRLHGCH